MSKSPLDEFHAQQEDSHRPNEEPVHSIHRIFTFAVTLVKRHIATLLPFVLFAAFINLSMEGYLKSLVLGLDMRLEDLIYLLQSGGSSSVKERMNSIASQMMFINLFGSVMIALIYTNCAAYIASGSVGGGTSGRDYSRIVGFIAANFITLAAIILIKYLLIGIGLTLFIIPGVMALLYLLFANYIYIFERKSIWESMTRSITLMDGVKINFITFISYAFLVFVPVWILNAVSGGSMYLVGFFIENDNPEFSILNFILACISVLLRELIWITYATGVCLLYLKRCKD